MTSLARGSLPQEVESAGAAGTATPAGLTVEDIETALAEILARPEFAPAEPPPLYRWLGAAFGWLRDLVVPFLERLFPDPDWSDPAWQTLGTVLLGMGALLGFGLLAYLLFLAYRALSRRRRARRADPSGDEAPTTATDWEALARAAAAAQDWRRAAMAQYQAVLLRLAAGGVLRLERSKTPGDYRRDIRRSDRALASDFDAFLRAFERLAYGPGVPAAEQYTVLAQSASGLGARG